ncbi:hypothetical protein RJT34_02776 [Clitoria ternatea]|uniref:5'-3' DNA helicase ZGRF1-like N-terminal domain-containing protein n=1 Tax=Clitoria ternatea TaxID=43366 RepID=A0AAN9Q466_CLITE
MGDSKRWTATYTKHIKQKRKVHQDGFLDLHITTRKLSLYDECEKLLECRLLKKDETVSSGETLTFNGYLVDIGDPEGDKKPKIDLNVDRKLKNDSRFKTPFDTPRNAKEKIAWVRKPLSPSQKVIREFKKRELIKYGSPKISQETPKPSTTEWQVLYTAQVTQKAKKYHDGFLRLVLRGSGGAQVMLFDAGRKLLDSRFLKKEDAIKSGESIAFDTYLIDIGEHQGSSRTPDSNIPGDKYNNVDRRKLDTQKISLDTDTQVTVEKTEWQVLYTTQLTQKAKKYHDGFLQLEFCGSLGRQVVLCDLGKRPLDRRFLKKNEVIRAGESIYFDGHLVEVGEPEGSQHSSVKLNERVISNNVVERRQIKQRQSGCHKANSSVAKAQSPGKLCGQDPGLNSFCTKMEDKKPSRIASPIKPLRDANQILSILRDPSPKPGDSYVTAACTGCSFQFTENVEMSHQSYSQKDAQRSMNEADFGLLSSSSAGDSCLTTDEGKSAEFWCKGETNTLHIGYSNSVKAELWGLLKGLSLAKDLNIAKLELLVDSKIMAISMASSSLTSIPLSSSLNVPQCCSKSSSMFPSPPIGAFSRISKPLFTQSTFHFYHKRNDSGFSIRAQTLDFSNSLFEGGFGSENDPNSPGTGLTAVEEKEEIQCPPGLRQYETMAVLRPDMTEDERLVLTQKYEELLVAGGGMYIEVFNRGVIPLAYSIKKKNKAGETNTYLDGIYLLFTYFTKPESLRALEETLLMDDNVIRSSSFKIRKRRY